jgi:hypothetical protein
MYLGLHKKSEHAWQLLRDRLVPAIGDLFEQPEPGPIDVEPNPPATTPAQPETQQSVHPAAPAPQATPSSAPPAAMVSNGRISLGAMRRRGA